jgi:3-phosphoshikimate 1-carboxyvinyltransferase
MKKTDAQTIVVESDWSSASYFYSIVALSAIGTEIKLSAYKKESLQGDSVLADIYKHFGVETEFGENSITLKKVSDVKGDLLQRNLIKAPDIAQTIAVTCFGMGISCELTGLHTLKIKETDRLEALKTELTKLGAEIEVTNHSLHLKARNTINSNISIETYNDHRMAMAFAPLGMLTSLTIVDANVVTKSYRNFWKDLKQIGFLWVKE